MHKILSVCKGHVPFQSISFHFGVQGWKNFETNGKVNLPLSLYSIEAPFLNAGKFSHPNNIAMYVLQVGPQA